MQWGAYKMNWPQTYKEDDLTCQKFPTMEFQHRSMLGTFICKNFHFVIPHTSSTLTPPPSLHSLCIRLLEPQTSHLTFYYILPSLHKFYPPYKCAVVSWESVCCVGKVNLRWRSQYLYLFVQKYYNHEPLKDGLLNLARFQSHSILHLPITLIAFHLPHP